MNFQKAISTLLVLLLILSFSMTVLKLGPHSALILGLVALCFLSSLSSRVPWEKLEDGMRKGINEGASALIILGMIGITIATWNLSGTLPTLLSYGLDFFSPRFFLVSSLLLCIVVSSFTGSSLTTCATIGAALMGVGHGFGADPAVLAGAIISGAFFGDKMSPLSDTTNFVPSVVGVNLYDHIKAMTVTTVPALILSFLFFLYMGNDSQVTNPEKLFSMQEALHTNFKISIFSLVPAALVLVLAIFKRPVLPTLFWGIASSLLTAGIVQENWNLTQWFQSMYFGVKLPIEQKEVAWIINRGGIESMLFTISLVIIALMLGGVLKASGIIEAFEKKLHSLSLKKRGLSILATFMAILVNFLTGEQYLSLLIPGQLLKENFEKANVSKTYLTRSLEDGGTLVNPLVPWGVCGAFISTQLGVSVISYAPYACFLYLGPIFTIIFAFRGEKDYL